ncbi:protein METABOLIC NETWORK MODULATOR 1-like [Bidens hawaiensis]|uniref:protein METABOLIC NETWORK MODULATOR 1-like n=1 Tax=Bidens hawaiensis TaxID=980011 RepID=UPI00404B0331
MDQAKRGPSRNNPSEKRAQSVRSHTTVPLPPGFAPLTNNTPRVDLINDPTQDMVGQVVTGVVQATFDGGYLLAVKIGNSRIPLTGAVSKPGHAAPITSENDVAPHVEVIKRAGIPIAAGIQPKRQLQQKSNENNMQLVTYIGNGPDPVDTAPPPPKTNYGLSSSVPQAGSRGTVVLQPKHLSNNIPNGISRNQPAPHLQASLSKQVHSVRPLAVYPPNGSISQPSYFPSSSQFGDMNEPLFVEPLQTRHPVQHFQPPTVFGGMPHGGTGKMTDLLNV